MRQKSGSEILSQQPAVAGLWEKQHHISEVGTGAVRVDQFGEVTDWSHYKVLLKSYVSHFVQL